METRPLAVSAATGSLSSTLFWLAKDFLSASSPVDLPLDFNCLDCPDLKIPLNFWGGLCCGLLLWPVLEVLVLAKQWLCLAVKARIAKVGSEGRLYRVVG